MNQHKKGLAFRALHRGPLFVMPNPWDAGSARLLAGLGYKALATTSAGFAWTLGRKDGAVTRAEALANAADIAAAVDLPVSGDLENGYRDAPAHAAETIRLAAEAGLVGGSIEDATGRAEAPIYDFEASVARVEAAAQAAHSLPFPFTFVARAENFLHGRRDLADTIRRLQAYEAAGADVLFAPGLPDLEAIRTVVAAVSKPLNVVLWQKQSPYTVAELAAAGVQRISTGGSLARAALGGLRDAASELLGPGTLSYLDHAMTTAEVHQFMAGRPG
ncbi:isocitrate lyase/phosphoenolpyruvate mutase family protein [Devosia sp.]|uniref:isocitrate lyase/PEP mutase family protein n=1 Tax=Devosia sp. TaxID=1871048 RepID=UPI001AC8D15A|nr:isocitrate lyase/phosphoenolpyruvate mutase family protein [Devosia sp.]MBN9310413.1 isocitrate lyase/phosphoenolpyruvate mutase family protein [Devosia sp.]